MTLSPQLPPVLPQEANPQVLVDLLSLSVRHSLSLAQLQWHAEKLHLVGLPDLVDACHASLSGRSIVEGA